MGMMKSMRTLERTRIPSLRQGTGVDFAVASERRVHENANCRTQPAIHYQAKSRMQTSAGTGNNGRIGKPGGIVVG
jgi:hypothetical protein